MSTGGIVLSGGKSRRMGRSKAMLPFGKERMLQRVVRLVREVVDPVVVVAAVAQELPELPDGVRILHDRRPDRGPLEGLRGGLETLRDRVEAAFVTACDVPLLVPDFARRMIELSAGFDVTVPHIEGYDHPLSGVYRTGLLDRIEALLAADRLRPVLLFDQVRTRRVTREELTDIDPELASLINVNSPADYRNTLARAALDVPKDLSNDVC